MKRGSIRNWVAACTVAALACTAAAQHAGDVWLGRSAAGELRLSPRGFVPEENYVSLNEVNGPLFFGWTDNNPGFDRLVDPEPASDVWPLQAGCNIWLEAVAIDPAFRLIDGGFGIVDEPGEDTQLGGASLHVHNTWHIDRNDADFDHDQCVWHATFVLRDDGSTDYAESRTFTFNFTSVPWGPLQEPPSYADGDFDDDLAVTWADFEALAVCLNGPERFAAPDDPAVTLCEVECVNAFDFGTTAAEIDLDVDLADAAEFQVAYGM